MSCEIAQDAISVVRLNPHNPTAIDRCAVTPLPSGLVTPSLNQPNIASPVDLASALKATLAKADIKTNKISLAIPDAAVKVAIHHLEKLPGNEHEKQQLLKWRLKKTTPFNVEESHLAYLQQPGANGSIVVLTASIFRDVLAQYEGLFRGLGMQVGLITPCSFAAFELIARSQTVALEKSLLFLRVAASTVSAFIVQKGTVVFFRHLDYEVTGSGQGGAGESKAESQAIVEGLYKEIHPCLMYCQDKLGASGVDQVCLSYPTDLENPLLSALSEKARCPVTKLDPRSQFLTYPSGAFPLVRNALIPALGLALGRF